MENNSRVKIKLHGEESNEWHYGILINARKKWVRLDDGDKLAPFIADESNITELKQI